LCPPVLDFDPGIDLLKDLESGNALPLIYPGRNIAQMARRCCRIQVLVQVQGGDSWKIATETGFSRMGWQEFPIL